MRRNRGRRRRNQGLTKARVIAAAKAAGFDDLAWLLESDHPMSDELFAAIRDAVGTPAPASAPSRAAPRGELTDAQAWRQLAELVPSALSDQPAAVRDALIAEFQRRAAA